MQLVIGRHSLLVKSTVYWNIWLKDNSVLSDRCLHSKVLAPDSLTLCLLQGGSTVKCFSDIRPRGSKQSKKRSYRGTNLSDFFASRLSILQLLWICWKWLSLQNFVSRLMVLEVSYTRFGGVTISFEFSGVWEWKNMKRMVILFICLILLCIVVWQAIPDPDRNHQAMPVSRSKCHFNEVSGSLFISVLILLSLFRRSTFQTVCWFQRHKHFPDHSDVQTGWTTRRHDAVTRRFHSVNYFV